LILGLDKWTNDPGILYLTDMSSSIISSTSNGFSGDAGYGDSSFLLTDEVLLD